MKLASILSLAAVSAVCVVSSSKATVVSAIEGDLILGFESTNTATATHNLEVNLGSIANFVDVDGNAKVNYTTTLTQLSAADISGIYGSDWNTRTDLKWSIAGTSRLSGDFGTFGLFDNTIFLSRARSSASLSTQTAPWSPLSADSLAVPASKIVGLYNYQAKSLGGKTSTANSAFAADIINGSSNDGSYTGQFAATGFQTGNAIQNTTNIAPGGYAVSDLYELASDGEGTNTSVYIGSFVLSNLGVLSFTTDVASFIGGNTVIPEPSTYAAVLGAAVLGFSALRRRKVATV